MEILNAIQKDWFRVLLETEICNERSMVENETVWEDGSPDKETAYAHRMNASNHSEYIRFLEGLKERYCS